MKLGQTQTLIMVRATDFGIYLAEDTRAGSERVLLPKRYVPEGLQLHDKVEVFLYRDSQDRLIATTRKPFLELNQIALLKVLQVTRIGAFLDWGLEKDLLLPYREQLRKVKEGEEVLVRLYIDKSQRLCASMRGLYDLLDTDSPYRKGDTVTGRVYEFSDNFGTFVAVDDRYSARIPRHEDHTNLRIGDCIQAYVTGVKADGKLDLTLRQKAAKQISADAESVLSMIESFGGVLPFNDKASPELILREAHMSKNAFKRAVGHLYKMRLIEFTEQGIRLTGRKH
ncbi:MAG TPA: RNA-binding protein [Lachnospiraceae bacterium]|nr:RNA-binding protein [Lachnospiraceae bacterium]